MERNLLCIIFILFFTSICKASPIYVSSDQFGHPVYSDTPPQLKTYQSIDAREVDTIKWQSSELKRTDRKLKSLKKSSRSAKKSFESTDSKKQLCEKLKNDIDRREQNLRTRLKADDFNRTKLELSHFRKQYRARCI